MTADDILRRLVDWDDSLLHSTVRGQMERDLIINDARAYLAREKGETCTVYLSLVKDAEGWTIDDWSDAPFNGSVAVRFTVPEPPPVIDGEVVEGE